MPSYGNIPLAAGCPKQWVAGRDFICSLLAKFSQMARKWCNLCSCAGRKPDFALRSNLGLRRLENSMCRSPLYLVLTDEPKIEAIDGRRLQDVRTFGKRTYVTVTNSQADSLQGSFGSSNGVAILICRRRRIAHAMTYRPNTLPRGYRASEPLGSLCCRPDLRPFLLLFRVPSF